MKKLTHSKYHVVDKMMLVFLDLVYYILSLVIISNIFEYLDTQEYTVEKETRELMLALAPFILLT